MEVNERRVLWWNVRRILSASGGLDLIRASRHVAKTGDIKDFLITEESGIAKGTRRIIAVTGQQAAEARRAGDSLVAKLKHLDGLAGKEKDTGLKAFQVVSVG